MKKILVVMMAFALALTMSMTAAAKDTVQVTLTSPAIVKVGCERAGAVTFSFDANTQIQTGDWWYFDLPSGVTICKKLDYFIVRGATPEDETDYVTIADTAAKRVTLSGGILGVPPSFPVGSQAGPMAVTDLGSGSAATTVTGGVMVFRVRASVGSQRVWVDVYGTTTSTVLTVGAATTFDLTILDGQAWENYILLNTDSKVENTWGDVEEDTIDYVNENVPHVENTLCVNAEEYSGSLVFISFDSLESKFTFTGDAQIAHVASDNPLSLAYCSDKVDRDETGDILIGGQNSCSFDYETTAGYCPDFTGNRIYLLGTTTFGDPDDRYDMSVTIETPGVYFTSVPSLAGFTPEEDKDCANTGTAVSPAWTYFNESGDEASGFPDASCSVTSNDRVRETLTTGGAITSIDTYDALWIDLPTMVYDTSIIGEGTEVEITVAFDKYPCGNIFSESVVIGTFVEACPVGGGATTLLYPFLPPLDGSIPGWWGGFVIVNAGPDDGTATLTLIEEDGDVATLTTETILSGTQWNAGAPATLLGMVTPADTNAGTFGDANLSVQVVCDFSLGGGFEFVGNGTEGVGCDAYVLGTDGWQ